MVLYHGPILSKTHYEFLSRANSKASSARIYHLNANNNFQKLSSLIGAVDTIEKCEEGLETIYSNIPGKPPLGSIPKEKWKKFLESYSKNNGNLYVPEQVLKIIEQLVVNNNINGALEIYDSINSSVEYGLVCDKDELTKIIEEHFPVLGSISRTYIR